LGNRYKEAALSRGAKFAIGVLFVLVLFSLALNGYLIWQWLSFQSQLMAAADQLEALRQTALGTIGQFRQELQAIDDLTLEYDVQIDDSLPVNAVVPFHERLDVPIQATVPISESIETSFDVDIPPFGLSVPVDVEVPVQLEVPIDLSVPIEIDRDVPVQTTVPISLEVPIAIDLADVGLRRYIELLDQSLADLERTLETAF
jgi:hypothetical protein